MSKPEIQIKRITEKIFGGFYAVFETLILNDFVEYTPRIRQFILDKEYSEDKILDGLKEEIYTILAAYYQGKVVGFAFGANWNGGVSSLYWLGVLKDFRKLGIGRKLLKTYEKEMKKQGIHTIEIRSPARNIHFYEKAGYIKVGLLKKTFFGVDDWFFYKIIQKPKEENFLKEPLNYSI